MFLLYIMILSVFRLPQPAIKGFLFRVLFSSKASSSVFEYFDTFILSFFVKKKKHDHDV